ncbi:hypothetical protein CO2235_MP40037 [Cupriavidus oxalaticus]|uniref:Uncharacterized protein n=1 Tax=Cupriavidus oxalaticus TaxID=96344 RepID=A0A375GFC9_9BURK|nr:hypothetical protein CO2235_MP40037 [Cupriavidus oxalaticus]
MPNSPPTAPSTPPRAKIRSEDSREWSGIGGGNAGAKVGRERAGAEHRKRESGKRSGASSYATGALAALH